DRRRCRRGPTAPQTGPPPWRPSQSAPRPRPVVEGFHAMPPTPVPPEAPRSGPCALQADRRVPLLSSTLTTSTLDNLNLFGPRRASSSAFPSLRNAAPQDTFVLHEFRACQVRASNLK